MRFVARGICSSACVSCIVARGPVPRALFFARPLGPHPCRSRSPDLDPFGIWRSRTTESGSACSVRDLAIPNYRGEGLFPVGQDRQILTRSGLLRWAGIVPDYRSARACPSHSSSCAGDRPPRYGGVTFFFDAVRDLAIPNYRERFPITVGRGPVPRIR